MEILRWGRWKSDVHVHIGLRVSSLEAVVRELRYRVSQKVTTTRVKYRLTCSMRSSRDEECSGPAPSRP